MAKDKNMIKEKKKEKTVNVNKKVSSYQSGKTTSSADLTSSKKK